MNRSDVRLKKYFNVVRLKFIYGDVQIQNEMKCL